jgi:hypothetical protein
VINLPGTSETAIWEQDGQYLSQTVGAAAITLGTVVAVGATDGYVITATDGISVPLGVAIAGYRISRIATDNQVAVGNKVTVATRGIVNVTCTGTVTRGELVQCDTAGTVKTLTLTASTDVNKIVGQALSTATAGTVKVKLMRG